MSKRFENAPGCQESEHSALRGVAFAIPEDMPHIKLELRRLAEEECLVGAKRMPGELEDIQPDLGNALSADSETN